MFNLNSIILGKKKLALYDFFVFLITLGQIVQFGNRECKRKTLERSIDLYKKFKLELNSIARKFNLKADRKDLIRNNKIIN